MGSLLSKKKINKLLDEEYYEPSSNFFCCTPCLSTNLKKNKWKKHFKEQCVLLKKFNVFWADILPRLLNDFAPRFPQERFQNELSSPQNILWDQLFLATQSDCRSMPSFRPELSINKLYASSDDEEDDDDEFYLLKGNISSDMVVENDAKIFEIYDADSIANGIFNLEHIYNSSNNKFHVRPYSNNLLLIKDWNYTSSENKRDIFNSLKYYQWATSVIESHFRNENSVLCFLKRDFVGLFQKKYSEKLENLKGRKFIQKDFEDLQSDCVVELLQFIRVLQEIVSLYYDLDSIRAKFSKLCLFTRDNLRNFTASIMLNDEFYHLIFTLHKRMYRSHARRFKKNLSTFNVYSPEKFGVPPALCLNQETLDYFRGQNLFDKNRNQSHARSPKSNETHIYRSLTKMDEELNQLRIEEDLRSRSEISMGMGDSRLKRPQISPLDRESKGKEEVYVDVNNLRPYESAIKTLKNVVFYRSPIHKLKIILKTQEKIERCIKKFYDKFDLNFSKELAGDEIVTIFLYILSRCNIPNLYAHLKFIDNFSTSNILNSKAGYYNATLQICVSHLEHIDVEGRIDLSEEEKESFFQSSIRSCLEEINQPLITSDSPMQDYEIIRKIGKGSFGNVLLVREKNTGHLFALKKIIPANEKPSNNSVNPLNEVDVLRSLDHFNIIKYYKCFGHKDKLCILMEYADDGDLLMRVIKAQQTNNLIPEKQIISWFSQICLALKHIHERNIIHRDIKVQNVFLMKNGLIKVGDFGISKILKNKNDFASTSIGTPYYYSPELCKSLNYSYKTDIWMLGCLLYELCSLEKPFPGNSYPEIIQKILNEEPKPIPKMYSPFIKSLIEKLLTKDQFKRPEINQLITIKEIKSEIERIEQIQEKQKNSENYLDVKKKTLSKPVSFGNLPTYSTEYNEINPKKTMTPHFIPQEIIKDFEKNSILNLIQQLNKQKRVASPNKLLPEKIPSTHEEAPKQISIFIPQQHQINQQITFEKYLQQKKNEEAKENDLFIQNKIHSTFYSNEGKIIKESQMNGPKARGSYEETEKKLQECEFYVVQKSREEIDKIPSKPEKTEEINVITRAEGRNSGGMENQSPAPPVEHSKSPLKRYHPKTPESNYPHPRLRDLITNHITNSIAKQGTKKRVGFDIEENTHNNHLITDAIGNNLLKEKERGREGHTNKRISPKSASLSKRKTYHIDWSDWFLDRVQKSQEVNNPRSIIMKEFLRYRSGKENLGKSPMKYVESDECKSQLYE